MLYVSSDFMCGPHFTCGPDFTCAPLNKNALHSPSIFSVGGIFSEVLVDVCHVVCSVV